jgi:TRAP-type C4-dicarboxylate transport system permease small subunit
MLVLSWIFIVLILVDILVDVALRNLFSFGIGALYSLVELLTAAAVFCGIAYSQILREHIAVTILVERLSPSWQRRMEIIVLFVSLIMFGLLGYGAWIRALESYRIGDVTSGTPGIWTWPAQAIMAAGFTLCCFEIVSQIATVMKGGGMPQSKEGNQLGP